MTQSNPHNAKPEPALRSINSPESFVAPCRDLAPSAPLDWLRMGWGDFRKTPVLSLIWGTFSVALFGAVAALAWMLGGWVLLISVLSGFIFIAPLMAFALYAVSRALDAGHRPGLAETLAAIRLPFGNALVFALVLLVIFLLWARAGSMVHVFFPADTGHEWSGLLTFLAVGSAIGSVFALVTFAASAFSLPFIANREVDVVTAVVSSVNAVLRNKWTMAVWVMLIVALMAVGLATALLGLAVIIPWLAYATWHGYRGALDTSAFKILPSPSAAHGND